MSGGDDLASAALAYAAQGLPVFPCNPLNKRPLTKHGFQDSSRDADIVAQWWKQWPTAMIGMPTGEASGIWVLDVDDPKAFEAAAPALPPTRKVMTGKGYHLHFANDPEVRNAQRHGARGWPFPELPGAEVRGEGGYVIVPPSVHPSGKAYTWANNDLPVSAPVSLLEVVTRKRGNLSDLYLEPRREVISAAGGSDAPYGLKALENEYVAILLAGDGEQESTLNEAALKLGALVAGGELSAKTAKAKLIEAGLGMTSHDPRNPWTDAVVRAKVERGLADGGKFPRSAPSNPPERASATPEDCDPETGELIDHTEPVDLWGQFNPPALPIGLLPPLIDQFARVNASRMGCDPAGLAMAAVTTCAAAISDAIKVKVKRHDDWTESARVWTALVGSPSTKKSPILNVASGPLCRLDANMMRDWLKRVASYDALAPEDKKGEARPKQTRLRIEDATVEAAQQVLEGSPWGVLLLQDELSGFFGAMDKYNGGKAAQADRAFWLRAFNGGPYAVNRVGRGSAVIDNLSVSMLGGIQPEPLRKVAGDAHDDGLLQRLFPIMLRPATMGCDEPMPPVNDNYRDLIECLHAMKPPGWMNTGVLQFDDDAQAIRRELEAKHLELQSLETINRKLAAHIGKYDGMFARLCITWHCIENADDPEALPETIGADIARRVAGFLHRFLLAHSIAFYAGCLGLSDDHDRLTAIAGHILARRLERVTNRDIARGDRTMRGLKDYEVRPLLEQLEALGWLERTEAPRPSSPPHFKVNPRVHDLFAVKAEAEARRRREARQTIAGLMA